MLILAADTSGKNGSIALTQATENGSCDVLEIFPLTGGTFSAQLVPQIAALLSKHAFDKKDIDAFAVASGPGSFTGLRVGLATIKALAEILQKPIAAVSLLEVLAIAGKSTGRILAVLNAARGEFYAGEYEINGDSAKLVYERLLKLEDIQQTGCEVIVTPDTSVVEAAEAVGLRSRLVEPPRSDAISRLGWQKIRAGETVSPEDLEANYIRRSDAEIFSRRCS